MASVSTLRGDGAHRLASPRSSDGHDGNDARRQGNHHWRCRAEHRVHLPAVALLEGGGVTYKLKENEGAGILRNIRQVVEHHDIGTVVTVGMSKEAWMAWLDWVKESQVIAKVETKEAAF